MISFCVFKLRRKLITSTQEILKDYRSPVLNLALLAFYLEVKDFAFGKPGSLVLDYNITSLFRAAPLIYHRRPTKQSDCSLKV